MAPILPNDVTRGDAGILATIQRAMATHQSGNLAEAERLYRLVLAVNSQHFEALHFLGVLQAQRGNREEASRLMSRSLEVDSSRPEPFANHARVLNELRRYEEALLQCDKALAIRVGYLDALMHRGNALRGMKRFDEALASYEKVLALRPDYAEALTNRGHALFDLKRYGEALASYDRALAFNPTLAECNQGRGNVFLQSHRYEEALAAYDKAFVVKPELDYLEGARFTCLMHLGCWTDFERTRRKIVEQVRAGQPAINPLAFMAISDAPGEQLACTKIYARYCLPAAKAPIWKGEVYRHEKIRLAYLSVDFREHVVSYLSVGMFEQHDRGRFEVVGISLSAPEASTMRSRLVPAFDQFLDVGDKSDQAIAELIRQLEVDILVDLTGFTGEARVGVFARRPAPVQVVYLGYPGSMGSPYYDYLLADETLIPETQTSHYSEKIAYLPSWNVNDSQRAISAPRSREELGLPQNAFVFCCLTATYKIGPIMFDLWMRLLRQVDGSVMWLTARTPTVSDNLRSEATARGVDPARLVFVPHGKYRYSEYLGNYRNADLFVDTLPMTAGATASDALWAGLPIITCVGNTFPGRIAASQLKALDLHELITGSLEEYEALALKLASEPAFLSSIKGKLARNSSTHPLFDTTRFTRHIEAAYRTMWERSQQRESPTTFAVSRAG